MPRHAIATAMPLRVSAAVYAFFHAYAMRAIMIPWIIDACLMLTPTLDFLMLLRRATADVDDTRHMARLLRGVASFG